MLSLELGIIKQQKKVCDVLIQMFPGIKTGRYTYEKRTQDILEVNRQRVEAVNAAEDEIIGKQESHLDEFINSMVKAKERLLSELQVSEVMLLVKGYSYIHKTEIS